MTKLKGWKKIFDKDNDGINVIRYESDYGSVLEIVSPWKHVPKTSFVSYSPFGGKTHIVYDKISKTEAIKNAIMLMKTHK